eukprot:SAG31_NODE_7957_length_1555_cov_1.326923_1_plen_150_part_00
MLCLTLTHSKFSASRPVRLPSLIQFVVEEYSLTDANKAMLLGAFYPGAWKLLATRPGIELLYTLLFSGDVGYLLTQLPSGIAIQKIGAKLTLTINMLGTALTGFLVPSMLGEGCYFLVFMGLFEKYGTDRESVTLQVRGVIHLARLSSA